MSSLEEHFYEIAAREVAEKRVLAGLMAKAYSKADGDDKKAVARYLRMRVKQLTSCRCMKPHLRLSANSRGALG
ncbi:MAG: hypothetical protein AB7I09_17945 [Planctomycetota bacterium]